MVRIDAGLYALRVGELTGTTGVVGGIAVPVAQISVPFAEEGNGVEIVATFPRRGAWVAKDGGTVILRSPPAGGFALVSVYNDAGQQSGELSLDLRRLDVADPAAGGAAAQANPPVPAQALAPGETRDVPLEVLLHIERTGDRVFPGRGWVGALGRRMRIEALSVRPLEGLTPTDLEMKGFLPNGGETPWVPGGMLCGTRGRGLPMIGFAVRVAPQRAARYDVVYQGSFFTGGISELHQNGDPCRAAAGDDPLEAINVRVIERGSNPA
ncbi:MAG TPA: hypothetical protein VHW90_03170 [Stellaceae bacterium]|nr:hypothetical protein [Stellaceae bacterium]